MRHYSLNCCKTTLDLFFKIYQGVLDLPLLHLLMQVAHKL
ncbi:hypothetical protein RDI58_010812 [Solanum bulbocastanum]|uniref:Uncharacterized protein n=1 Tax=Solanum bulbocastanum TaxID=147425 RepID=A0AAN8TUA2_SOLBU